MKKLIPLLISVMLIVGCGTLFTSVTTVTQVVDSAMKQWAHASNTHQTTAAFDAQVVATHDRYRAAAAGAQVSLKAYQSSGNASEFNAALAAAQAGAGPLVDLIASILTPVNSATLKTSLTKTSKP